MPGATIWCRCRGAATFEELNAQLEARCRRRFDDRLRGHDAAIGTRLAADQAAFLDLPAVPYEPCDRRPGRVSSLSLVRYRNNDYSVPTAYGHRAVMIRGYVDQVEIVCGSEQIACHRRSYAREDFVFDPLHYLALLSRSRVRSTRRRRWRAGNCPMGSVCCVGCSKPAWARLASGSSSRFCVC